LACGAICASVALTSVGPAFAANPSIVTDPVGDASYKAPAYMDVVGAQLAASGGTLEFQMSVAGAIPASPELPPPATKLITWGWPLDTDPTTFPAGAPLAPGLSGPAEFVVAVAWDGSTFSAFLQDRRPLLTGGQATLTALSPTISGTQLRVDVQASDLGNPSSFAWGAGTFYWPGPFKSNNAIHFVDVVSPFYTPGPT
jgi:hypothetical protein